ncbi:MAG: erythromycin esterase family protein [Planctomycetia bacterium]|nr:erythromycin esterase family protein [Planctomycetia bacterium]
MTGRTLKIAFAVFVLIVVPLAPAAAQPPTDANVAWIRQHAIPIKTVVAGAPLDDLAPLKAAIGDARIVSLGESTHGSREIFQMKHRLLEFLVSEMGFTIFSIEANMPESYRLNDYVLRGEGNPDQLIGGMYFWTWNTREVKDMVEWMRKFNQSAKAEGNSRHVEFTGFDMQTPDVAMEEVLKFLSRAERAQHTAAKAAYARAAVATQVAQNEFGVATGSFPVEAARGKKVTYRGWIKTENVEGFAGLWWRIDGPNQKSLGFDNMAARQIKGTRDWQQYSIELNVPAEAENINFGVILPGKGTAWFDALEVLIDGKPFAKPEAFDFDFESDAVRGLAVMPLRTYRTELDAKVAKSGKQSLRLQSIDARAGTSPEEFKTILAACEEVHKQLVRARGDLLKSQAAKDVNWAIANARLVVTAMQQRGGDYAVRDAAMADNVAWILDQHPGAKIVLWAHNGHVNRQPFAMGKHLDQKFGKQHVVIGFATLAGKYRAIGKGRLGDHDLQKPPADSYEAAFQNAGHPRFFLDLRAVKRDSDDSGWLAKPHPFRSIGALAMDQQFYPVELPALFDAVIHLEETTAAQPLGP